MKHLRKKSSSRLTKDAERLAQLASDATRAGSRVESRFWDVALETVATQLLMDGNDAALETALDETYKQNPDAHDLLVESVEAAAESCVFDIGGIDYQGSF